MLVITWVIVSNSHIIKCYYLESSKWRFLVPSILGILGGDIYLQVSSVTVPLKSLF